MSQNGAEKELILGNKQLISLFFIVVALCAVFFAMGYIVRGNSVKGSAALDTSVAAADPTVKRQQPEPPRETTESLPAAPPARISEAPVETHPAADAPATATPVPVAEPEAGTSYIQVAALGLPDAENMVRTLKEQHFTAGIAPSSKDNLYRVRVGPFHSTADVAVAKQRLKTLGFSDVMVQKQ